MDEPIQGPRRLALLHTTIQAGIDRRHDARAQAVHGHLGRDRHLAHDRLAQHAVALPVVPRVRPAAVQPHALHERGLDLERRGPRPGVPLRGGGDPPVCVRRGRRRGWGGGVGGGVWGGGVWGRRRTGDGDDDRDRARARVRRLLGQRCRGRPRFVRRPAPGRIKTDTPPFLAFYAKSFRVHERKTGYEGHPVRGGIGLGQVENGNR